MSTQTTILLICLVWGIVAVAGGLTAIALIRDVQAVLFFGLTVGLIIIAGAATWRLWSKRMKTA